LTVVAGEQPTVIATAEFLMLQIEVKQKRRTTHVEIKVRWPRRPLIRAAVPRGASNGG
jgi:hypothetical protein